MGATIDSAYHKLSGELITVEELKRIREKDPSRFAREYKKNLFCPNHPKGCTAELVFAVRKGTPYLRTHPDSEHHKKINICPLEKTKTESKKRGRKNRKEVKRGKKERYLGSESNVEVSLGEKSIEKILQIIERIENKTKGIKQKVAYELPEQKGIKKTARYIDADVKISETEAKVLETVDTLRELRSNNIRDIHIGKYRIVYGKLKEVSRLEDGRLVAVLEGNFRIVFDKEILEKMEITISKEDIGKILIVPVVIYKSKQEIFEKFGNRFYGRVIKGLEGFIRFQKVS